MGPQKVCDLADVTTPPSQDQFGGRVPDIADLAATCLHRFSSSQELLVPSLAGAHVDARHMDCRIAPGQLTNAAHP